MDISWDGDLHDSAGTNRKIHHHDVQAHWRRDMGWQGSRPEHKDVIKYWGLATDGFGWILFGGGDIKWWWQVQNINLPIPDLKNESWRPIHTLELQWIWFDPDRVFFYINLHYINTLQRKLWYIWFVHHIYRLTFSYFTMFIFINPFMFSILMAISISNVSSPHSVSLSHQLSDGTGHQRWWTSIWSTLP